MNSASNDQRPATATGRPAIRLVAALTLFLGCGYVLTGSRLLLVWFDWLPSENQSFPERVLFMTFGFGRDWNFLILLGVLFLVLGMVTSIAGLALFWGKAWSRALALVVAVLAVSSGLYIPVLVPDSGAIESCLSLVQFAYAGLVFVVLGWNRDEPAGLNVLRLVNLLLGIPYALVMAISVPEAMSYFLVPESSGRRDIADTFASLTMLSGFVGGCCMLATGMCLLWPHWKRYMLAVRLLMATAGAHVAMAAFALLGALLGHTRPGLLESFLVCAGFPFALALLALTGAEIWYLKRQENARCDRAPAG
jgi:hypothetical protein